MIQFNYFAHVFQINLYATYIYYLLFNFPWGVFVFVWGVTTASTSIPLLILFPIGIALLYISCRSWIYLFQFEIYMHSFLFEEKVGMDSLNLELNYENGLLKHVKSTVLNGTVWKMFLYLVLFKFPSSIVMFVLTLLPFGLYTGNWNTNLLIPFLADFFSIPVWCGYVIAIAFTVVTFPVLLWFTGVVYLKERQFIRICVS
ncbi:hypothetical protein BC833DRAFT_596973 [Globomyces pollinis-pini]|nr:hypothetical protein BC833DRAFT_596973 [Globomyces pollinis-pini]